MKSVYRHTTHYIVYICKSYVYRGSVKAFIWSIPPICSCTYYNINKSNNIIILIRVLAFDVI